MRFLKPKFSHHPNSRIIFAIDHDADENPDQIIQSIATKLKLQTNASIQYQITKDDIGVEHFSLCLDDFATIEPYILNDPDINLAPNVLKNEVLALIERNELKLQAGLVTNARSNSNITSIMFSGAYDIPIRNIALNCPLHTKGEIWSKILSEYQLFKKFKPHHKGPATAMWRAHAARLSDEMFSEISEVTEYVAINTRNPNLVIESAIRSIILNNKPSPADLIGILAQNFKKKLSPKFLTILSDENIVRQKIQNEWEYQKNRCCRTGILKIMNYYAAFNSQFQNWDELKTYCLQSKDYTSLENILRFVSSDLAPSDLRTLPSASLALPINPLGFAVESYKKQIDFSKIREKQGKKFIIVDTSSIQTTPALRKRFANSMGVESDQLLINNIQKKLPSFIKRPIGDDVKHLVDDTYESNEIYHARKSPIPKSSFPKIAQTILDSALEFYAQQMVHSNSICIQSFEELLELFSLDTSKNIAQEMNNSDLELETAYINVDPLTCLVFAEKFRSNSPGKQVDHFIALLDSRHEMHGVHDQATVIQKTMRNVIKDMNVH